MLCLVAQSCLTLGNPMDCSPSGSSVHGDSPGKNTGVGCLPPGDLPNPGTEPRSPTFQENTLLSEPLEKCKNSSGDLQDQGINQGLLHCRWILYKLSYQGSLYHVLDNINFFFWIHLKLKDKPWVFFQLSSHFIVESRVQILQLIKGRTWVRI